MATPVKYKKPRRINPVSVTLAAVVAFVALLAWEYAPLFMVEQEAYRVLESYGSTFVGRHTLYTDDPIARDRLRLKMNAELRLAGVSDPELESWIEIEGREVRLGVVYSKFIDWPFNVVKRTEEVYEIEHTFLLD
ncbi:MAG: hypothetical protein JKY37_30900 [Nannocystaceae bacterium]|nr:hypothetical protein [Nannocystaceae bacterium]